MAGKSEPVISVIPEDEGKEKFKKSEDVAFYRRQIQGPNLKHRLLLDTLVLTEKGAHFEILEDNTKTRLLLSVSPCKNDIVRIVIDEARPIKARYRVPDVLSEEPRSDQLRVESQTKDSITLSWSSGHYQVRLWHFPFRLEIVFDHEVVVTFNSKDKLWFESLQNPPSFKRTSKVHCGRRLLGILWTSKQMVPAASALTSAFMASSMSTVCQNTQTGCSSETLVMVNPIDYTT
ncbi:hypothetical protein CHARACLAT_025396 [Characodon lateralis]|uniref:Uncharacterized protein n=1 Tax=Characodon lateralis TaxID=208331 RepID=A0ABU7DUR2_9TELE|nr:hypothetical protein [Characodon lateralis]